MGSLRTSARCAGVTEQLVDCSGGNDVTLAGGTRRKLAALWALLQRHTVPHTIVFCNKIDACRAVENFLRRQDRRAGDFDVLPYHDALDRDVRTRNLRHFLTPPEPGAPQRVLVCTDRCASPLSAPLQAAGNGYKDMKPHRVPRPGGAHRSRPAVVHPLLAIDPKPCRVKSQRGRMRGRHC